MKDPNPATAEQRLLDAASRVVSARGYAASRVSDIVAEAGFGQGTFYLYFRNKQAVFMALIDRFFEELLAQTLGTYPAVQLETAAMMRRQITDIWRIILAYARERPELARLVLRDAASLPPHERSRIDRNYTRAAAGLSAYCCEAQRRGLLRDVNPDLAGWLVIGMVEKAVHYAILVAPEKDIETIVEDLVTVELSGLLKTEAGQ